MRRFKVMSVEVMGKALVAVLALGLAAGAGSAAASAPTPIGVWQAPLVVIHNENEEDGDSASIAAISCASSGNCSAVGQFHGTLERNGASVWEGFVVDETDGTWGTAQMVADDNDDLYRFTAISCSSPGNCAAVGNDEFAGFAMDETAGTWGAPQDIVGSESRGASLTSVSCPSDGECTAAGRLDVVETLFDGQTQTVAIAQSAGAWQAPVVLPGSLNTEAGLTSISCASAGNCSAGGYYDAQPAGPLPGEGYVLVANETDGTWTPVQDLDGSFNEVGNIDVDAVTSVSCSSAGNCSAGGYYGTFDGAEHAFVVSESEGAWGEVVEIAQSLDKSGSKITSISCPSDGNCSAGGLYVDSDADPQALVIEETDGAWQPAQEVAGALNVGGYAEITSMSCPSTGNCSAGGYYANESGAFVALVDTETDDTWDAGQGVAASPGSDGLAQINSISCPSLGGCAAGGVWDDVNGFTQAFIVDEVPELPGPPLVVTGAASSVTPNSSTLNATANPNGTEVSDCHFEYGTTTLYGASIPCTTLPGSGNSAVAVAAPLGSLASNTTYHFRIVATNLGGTSYGLDETVATPLSVPEEAAITKKHEEEAAAKKNAEAEAAATKKSEESGVLGAKEEMKAPATGSISLDGSTITVQLNHEALIKLTCTGTATCSGKLALTAKAPGRKGKTKNIGTITFSIPAGRSETVKPTLNGTGRALLSAAHGHLRSTLTILKVSPSPSKTQAQGVHLVKAKSKK